MTHGGLEVFRSEHLRGVLDVLSRAMPRDPISRARFTRQVLLDANFRPDGAPVALRDGKVVGFCLGLARHVPLENAPPDAERGYITLLAVAPEHQRQGIGTALLAHAEKYFRAQRRTLIFVSSYAPHYFIPGVDVAAYAGALSFFARHGYSEVYRPLAMETSLWEWKPPATLEEKRARLARDGVMIENYTPESTLALLDFVAREFPGDWVRVVRETATRILHGEPHNRLIYAHENGRVLGFSHYENERFGPIGVASSERGRGLGQVLMWETLRAQREQGLRASWFLWSDDNTAAKIYNAAGFREVRRFALLKKSLTTDEHR